MKKAICLGSLPAEGSLLDRLKFAKQAGFEGVELTGMGEGADFAGAKAAADEAGIALHSVMANAHWGHPLSHKDPAEREKCIADVKACLEGARAVGADAVLLVPGVVNEETTYEEAWERSVEGINALIPAAEAAGVVIAVENVWNKFLLSPIEFAQYVDGFGSPWVQAYFDVGNILLYGYPHHWIRSLGRRIRKVHIKDFETGSNTWRWLLEGNVPWAEVIRALRDVGYEGYLTAELGLYRTCPDQAVLDISAAMDRILAL
jgi:L-ribulose-5-phosphate 3-epimerase